MESQTYDCLVVVEHRFPLCWTHYPTEQQNGSGKQRMSCPRRVSEVGPFWVTVFVHGENLACQYQIIHADHKSVMKKVTEKEKR